MSEPARNTCLACGGERLSQVTRLRRSGVPHGDPGHDVQFDYVVVDRCPRCGHGQMEKLSHDCFQSYDADGNYEDWDMYWWYVFAPEHLQPILQTIDGCPLPLDPECSCWAHTRLRRASEGLWGGVPHAPFARGSARHALVKLAQAEERWSFEVLGQASSAVPSRAPESPPNDRIQDPFVPRPAEEEASPGLFERVRALLRRL